MPKTLREVTYNILVQLPEQEWSECYDILFQRCIEDNDVDLARKVFAEIIADAIRLQDCWLLENFLNPQNEMFLALERLMLIELTKAVIKGVTDSVACSYRGKDSFFDYSEQEIEFNESFMAQFRDRRGTLCACCHDYVLTCEEIQEFPLKSNEKYIRNTFRKALTEGYIHKRTFIVEYMLNNLTRRGHNPELILDLWYKAELSGCRCKVRGMKDALSYLIAKQENIIKLIKIFTFTDRVHDSLISDLVELYLKKGRFSFAFYFNSKISSSFTRLSNAIIKALNNKLNEVKEIEFVEKTSRLRGI